MLGLHCPSSLQQQLCCSLLFFFYWIKQTENSALQHLELSRCFLFFFLPMEAVNFRLKGLFRTQWDSLSGLLLSCHGNTFPSESDFDCDPNHFYMIAIKSTWWKSQEWEENWSYTRRTVLLFIFCWSLQNHSVGTAMAPLKVSRVSPLILTADDCCAKTKFLEPVCTLTDR